MSISLADIFDGLLIIPVNRGDYFAEKYTYRVGTNRDGLAWVLNDKSDYIFLDKPEMLARFNKYENQIINKNKGITKMNNKKSTSGTINKTMMSLGFSLLKKLWKEVDDQKLITLMQLYFTKKFFDRLLNLLLEFYDEEVKPTLENTDED